MSLRRVGALSILLTGIGIWSVAAVDNQTSSAAALPETLRRHVQEERLGIVTSIRGLPLGVRDELEELFGGGGLDIAEPGAAFRVNDASTNLTLPLRRLVMGACSIDWCIVYYERGGTAHEWRVALFHWTPDETRFEWGGVAPGGLKTIDEVRKAILSGAIKEVMSSW